MNQLREWFNRLWNTVLQQSVEREWDEEMRLHLELATDAAQRSGEDRADALRIARARAGDVASSLDAMRDQRGLPWLEDLARDTRRGLQGLRRHPAFTVVAVLTLALGIGANAAVFSVVNAVLLRPLPFPEPHRLVAVETLIAGEYLVLREHARSLAMALYRADVGFNLSSTGEPERINGARVSANFFSTLGIAPQIGRTFAANEEDPGAPLVVILSDGLWRERFGGDRAIVGREIVVDAETRTVVGVMPAGFNFPRAGTRLWTPITFDRRSPVAIWGGVGGSVVARLASDATAAQAQTELRALAPELRKANTLWVFPPGQGTSRRVIPLQENIVGGVRTRLFVILGAVAFVLLIACANVANLVLARANARERDLAVQQALGARRGRLVRQLLTESAVLGVIGGIGGTLLASWCVHALAGALPADVPRTDEIALDVRVLGFSVVVSLLTGLGFGLLPALRASRPLHRTDRTSNHAFGRATSLLVIGEVAVAVVLVIGAGLLIRSFVELLRVDPGFRTEQVLAARITPPLSRYGEICTRDCSADPGTVRQRVFYEEVLARVRAIPGVTAVEATNTLPMTSDGWFGMSLEVEGRPYEPGVYAPSTIQRRVTPGYLQAMGIETLKGRPLSPSDARSGPRVAVINETMARQHWPRTDPIGKRFREVWRRDWITVVGVVRDVKYGGPTGAVSEEIYQPFDQQPARDMSLVIRTSLQPGAIAAALRGAVATVDDSVPVSDLRTVEEIVSGSVAQPRFTTMLLTSFAGLALALAAIGIYGVLSYAVGLRTREIGVRIALGARRVDVLRLVVRQAMRLVYIGTALGLAAALATNRAIEGLLFNVGAFDLRTFTIVPLVLIGVALAAASVPASRATRIEPVAALTHGD